jgi:uncharacterized membrane protein
MKRILSWALDNFGHLFGAAIFVCLLVILFVTR